MKTKQNSFSNGQQQEEKSTLLCKFKVVLMGKDFQPIPSYWALIPIGQPNILRMRKK
jgi:hypothetical protein